MKFSKTVLYRERFVSTTLFYYLKKKIKKSAARTCWISDPSFINVGLLLETK